MRRTVAVVLLAAAFALAAALPASAQATTVTYSGPVTAGQFLELTCPEGLQVQIFQATSTLSASVSFYRNKNRTAVVTSDQGPGGSVNFVGWTVPKGARYADAYLTCEPFPTNIRHTGHFDAAGETATVVCPPETPYPWSIGPVIFESDEGQSTVLYDTRVYDAAGQWVGITFTAPEPGTWWVDLNCAWRPIE
jgi:hypothetical protein